MKLKKTYKYALVSSFYLTLLSVMVGVFNYLFLYDTLGIFVIFVFVILIFILSFFVIQYRAEHFIYRKIKTIYKKFSDLDVKELDRKSITTDIESISQSVEKFVEGKQLEIQNLTDIDSFRRDFLGNLAHELKTPLFTVQGYILTLIEGGVNDKEIRTKYLDRANKGVERLVAVIKDLDTIAKLETDGFSLNIEIFNLL